MSPLASSAMGIENAWKALSHQWQTTASVWKDAARRTFQAKYMDAYEPVIMEAVREMLALDHVIDQANKDVK